MSNTLKVKATQDFTRLLTVNPRGYVYISDEYFNADEAHAHEMVLGPAGERILIGDSFVSYQIEKPGPLQPGAGPQTRRSLDGWVAAAAASEPYQDPCLEPYNFSP